jgi:hypothetical protein
MMSTEGYPIPKYLDDTTGSRMYVGHFMLSDTPTGQPPSASRLVQPGSVDFKPPLPHDVLSLRRQLNEVNDAEWMKDIEGVSRLYHLGPTEAYVAATTTSIPLLDVARGFHSRAQTPLQPLLAGPSSLTPEWRRLSSLDHVSVLLHHAELNHEAARMVLQKLFDRDVKHITVLQGRYYKGVKRADIDEERLTSRHADFMQFIGQNCLWQ